MKRKMEKMTIADAVSEVYGELTGLGEELREWADNIEEKFGSTDKYQRLDDSASTLEELNEPDVPESLGSIEVEIMEPPRGKKGASRPKRRDHAVYMLDVVEGALQEVVDTPASPDTLAQDKRDDAENLANEVCDLKGEAENVEFPGMYG